MVAAGANSDKPHYFGGNDRRVEKNDIVMVDSGGWYDDYSHDMTRTFFVGSATDEQRKVYDIVLRAQLAAEQLVEIGAIPKRKARRSRSHRERRVRRIFSPPPGARNRP
ncbi:hypothetical protein MASR2M79_07300 [Aminivibrio sp.]